MDKASIKLSPALRDLVRSSGQAPRTITTDQLLQVFDNVRMNSQKAGALGPIYLLILTGVLFSLNQTSSLAHLFKYACRHPFEDEAEPSLAHRIFVAGFMREAGLRTVSFLGIPKVINCLAVLSKAIDEDEEVKTALPSASRRAVTSENVRETQARGRTLWDDIYAPHHDKLLGILGHSHPDLPTHILQSHYSPLLSSLPPILSLPTDLSREQSSVLAVTCLRAQGGVGRQVESHVYGLRKANFGGTQGWITSEDGCLWLLNTIDGLVDETTL